MWSDAYCLTFSSPCLCSFPSSHKGLSIGEREQVLCGKPLVVVGAFGGMLALCSAHPGLNVWRSSNSLLKTSLFISPRLNKLIYQPKACSKVGDPFSRGR